MPDLMADLVSLDDNTVEPGDSVILITRVENEGTLVRVTLPLCSRADDPCGD